MASHESCLTEIHLSFFAFSSMQEVRFSGLWSTESLAVERFPQGEYPLWRQTGKGQVNLSSVTM